MAEALKALKDRQCPKISDEEVTTVLNRPWLSKSPKQLKKVSAEAVVRKFLLNPLQEKRAFLALPKSVLADIADDLFTWRRICKDNELTTYPALLESILESGAPSQVELNIWARNQSELEKLLVQIPVRLPQLKKVVFSSFLFFSENPGPEVLIPSAWGSLEKLTSIKMPINNLSAQSIRTLVNLRVLECRIGKEDVCSDLVAISDLKKLVDLDLTFSDTVPGALAGAGLAAVVGQLPFLRKINCGPYVSVMSSFVGAVGPYLEDRAEKLQLKYLGVNNEVLKSFVAMPSKLELKMMDVYGPLDKEAVLSLQSANSDTLYELRVNNVQPSALYEVMKHFGCSLRRLNLKTDNQEQRFLESLELHRVLAPAPNLEYLCIAVEDFLLANPLPHQLEMISGKKMHTFGAYWGIDTAAHEEVPEQIEIAAKYWKHYLQQSESVHILRSVSPQLVKSTLDTLKNDPCCCLQVDEVEIDIDDREHLIDPAVELTTLLALQAPLLKYIRWSNWELDDQGEKTAKTVLMEDKYKWFVNFLHETGLIVDFDQFG